MAEPNDTVSIDIAAPPKKLWQMVSDITNMPRWSPETYRTRWIRGATGPVPGARFKGSNRWHRLRWSTTVEVQVAEPGREFTFVTVMTGKQRTQWRYVFEEHDGGTRVTESRTVISREWLRATFQDWFMPGHVAGFKDGMLTTLQRLKQAAEAD